MAFYPGFGLPLRDYPQHHMEFYPLGNHPGCIGSQSDLLLVREVFDGNIVAKWRAEALAYPDEDLWTIAANNKNLLPVTGIMTDKAFDYCIRELQGKARFFTKTRIIPTLDAIAVAIAKSDCLIPPAVTNALRNAFKRLKKDQQGFPDWHPGTDEKFLNLVHPSMYPLVFKSTKCLPKEVVGVADAVAKWAGKGTVIDNKDTSEDEDDGIVAPEFWSEDYQWLPSNVTIMRDDGSVKFTSYINNLHPTKYPEIYSAIEKLVENALPMWDQCLYDMVDDYKKEGAGRNVSRFSFLDDLCNDNMDNWNPSSWKDLETTKSSEAEKNKKDKGEDGGTSGSVEIGSQDSHDCVSNEEEMKEKWRKVRRPVLPEPNPFEEIDYSPRSKLLENFYLRGLQIIVKMVSIELTPDKPNYPAGSWRVEGQMNEHICATALYYLDSENVTTNHLDFRMLSDPDLILQKAESLNNEDQAEWLGRVHGTELWYHNAGVQNYGSVETPEGRFLAFPNVFQHRVSSFQLVDPTKPGHRRYIALLLVDPHTRIISTANVPPQQQDWWTESLLGQSPESQEASLAKFPAELAQLLKEKGLTGKAQPNYTTWKLPVELMEMVRKYSDESPVMSDEEARAHKLKMMDELAKFREPTNNSCHNSNDNYCEH